MSNNAIYGTPGRIYYVITTWNKLDNSLSKIIFFEIFLNFMKILSINNTPK